MNKRKDKPFSLAEGCYVHPVTTKIGALYFEDKVKPEKVRFCIDAIRASNTFSYVLALPHGTMLKALKEEELEKWIEMAQSVLNAKRGVTNE